MKIPSRRCIVFISLGVLLFSHTPFVLASKVKAKALKEGLIILEDSREVSLAGLIIAPEAENVLQTLLADQSLEIVEEPNRNAKRSEQDIPVYAYLTTREMKLTDKQPSEMDSKKIMVNELLLKMGAAQVDSTLAFQHKDAFIKIQEQAKIEGEGIWSYAVSQG